MSLAFLSLLCGNHDHAVGSTTTVYSRSRSVLQHVQTLYVSHVESIDAKVGGHAVNHDERVTVVYRSHTTHLDGDVVARLACVHHLQTGYLTLNGLSDVSHRRVLHVLCGKRADGSSKVLFLHYAITYDHQLVELVYVLSHDNLKRRLAVYSNTLVVVSDVGNLEYCIVGNGDGELSIKIGYCGILRAFLSDGGSDDGLSIGVLHHAVDCLALCVCACRQHCKKRTCDNLADPFSIGWVHIILHFSC